MYLSHYSEIHCYPQHSPPPPSIVCQLITAKLYSIVYPDTINIGIGLYLPLWWDTTINPKRFSLEVKRKSANCSWWPLLTVLHVTFSWLARILVALQCFVSFTVHLSRLLVYTIYKLKNFISRMEKTCGQNVLARIRILLFKLLKKCSKFSEWELSFI